MISFHESEREDDDMRPDDASGRDDLGDLDDEFPLGDGTAETEGVVICPYCGELNEVTLDPGSGARQEYVEDCQVCCQPWQVTVRYDAYGDAQIIADAIDES